MGDHAVPKILIVDDAPENLEILAELLSDYRRVVALDGAKALELARTTQPPDLIILDVMMPGLDGFQVCERLKSDAATQAIPVIFVTARGRIADETRGLELGAVDYISKPFSPTVVLARVRTHLALAQARRDLERQNFDLIEAGKLRDEVERIMHHDLKSPLATILGYSQILARSKRIGEEEQADLEALQKAGKRMLYMINMSLDLFKMERGLYRLSPTSLDLLHLLRELCEELGAFASERQVRITLENAEASCSVCGEEMLCYSMFANLLKNACEASPEGGLVTLTVRPGAEIVIHNTGAVPLEVRGRFFQKFVTAGKLGGTGLGAYSARLIAETLGGEIEMRTSDDAGTDLIVRLPSA